MGRLMLIILLVSMNSCDNGSNYKRIGNEQLQKTVLGDSEQVLTINQQIMVYHDAIEKGELDTAYGFLYSGMIKYLQLQYSSEKLDSVYWIDNVLRPSYLKWLNVNRKLRASHIKPNYIIRKVGCKTVSNGAIIYVVHTALEATIKGVKIAMKLPFNRPEFT